MALFSKKSSLMYPAAALAVTGISSVLPEKLRAAPVNVNSQTRQIVSVDNIGTENTGDFRFNWTWLSQGTTGKTTAFSLSTSPDHTDNVYGAQVFYKTNVKDSKDSAYLTAAYSKNNADANNFTINEFALSGSTKPYSESKNLGMHYVHVIPSNAGQNQTIDYGVDYKINNSKALLDLGGASTTIYDDHIKSLPFSVSYQNIKKTGNQVFYYTLNPVYNLSGNKADYNLSNQGASGPNGDDVKAHYSMVRFNTGYQQKFDNSGVLNIAVNGQYTSERLINNERMGLGGMYTVRGFNESDVVGDKALKATVEYYFPTKQQNQRFLVFVDQGKYWSNKAPASEIVTSDSLASCGLGWRYMDQKGYSASIDFGYVLDGTKDTAGNVKTDKGHTKIHFSVSKAF